MENLICMPLPMRRDVEWGTKHNSFLAKDIWRHICGVLHTAHTFKSKSSRLNKHLCKEHVASVREAREKLNLADPKPHGETPKSAWVDCIAVNLEFASNGSSTPLELLVCFLVGAEVVFLVRIRDNIWDFFSSLLPISVFWKGHLEDQFWHLPPLLFEVKSNWLLTI